MALIVTSNWNDIQIRTIDPFSDVNSSKIANRLNALLGDNIKLKGLKLSLVYDDIEDILYLSYTPGKFIKDNMLIEFTDTVVLSMEAFSTSDNKPYHVCIDYKYEIIYPQNIARIVIVDDTEYDSSRHMILHTITKIDGTFETIQVREITPYLFEDSYKESIVFKNTTNATYYFGEVNNIISNLEQPTVVSSINYETLNNQPVNVLIDNYINSTYVQGVVLPTSFTIDTVLGYDLKVSKFPILLKENNKYIGYHVEYLHTIVLRYIAMENAQEYTYTFVLDFNSIPEIVPNISLMIDFKNTSIEV